MSQACLYDERKVLLYFEVMDENSNLDIAAFIKKARRAMNLTQEAFAEAFGCTKANVSGWELGRHEPTYRTLCNISKKSGVPLPHDGIDLLAYLGIDLGQLDRKRMALIKAIAEITDEEFDDTKRLFDAAHNIASNKKKKKKQIGGP